MTLHAHNQFKLVFHIQQHGDLLEPYQMGMEIINPRFVPREGEFLHIAKKVYKVTSVVHDIDDNRILVYAKGS